MMEEDDEIYFLDDEDVDEEVIATRLLSKEKNNIIKQTIQEFCWETKQSIKILPQKISV